MGLRPEADWTLLPTMQGWSAESEHPLEELLPEHDPEVATSRALYRQSEARLRGAVASQWPGAALGPGLESDEGNTKVGPAITTSIPIWNRNQGPIAVARAQRDRARAGFESSLEAAMARVHRARADLERRRARARGLEEEVTPLVLRQWQELRELSAYGELDVTLLREAWSGALELRLERVDVDLECAQRRAELAWWTMPWSLPDGGPRPEEVDG